MNYRGSGLYEDKPNPGANRALGQRRQVVIPREILGQ
jgi:hypothetical protein